MQNLSSRKKTSKCNNQRNHLHPLWWSEFRRLLHRCSSSYLTYLTDYTSYLSLPMIFVLLSSAGLFLDAPWRAQYVAEASVAGRLTYFKRWQQYKTADHSWSTKQPLSMGCRREDYLRLPFACRRSGPTQCNAGLPNKRILQQDKINKKTNPVILVSTMP